MYTYLFVEIKNLFLIFIFCTMAERQYWVILREILTFFSINIDLMLKIWIGEKNSNS